MIERGKKPSDVPKISVGLAVYNGERYLQEAIESFLCQTLGDFELIISDNASTDRTGAIAKEYAKRDLRVRYYRNATNIGPAANENQSFLLSRGEYFHWAGHDDVCAPQFFAECVAILDGHPSIVLCQSAVLDVDAEGNPVGQASWCDASSEHAHIRFRNVIRMNHHCNEFYGMIRAEALRKTRLEQNYVDSDRTLLAQLSLYGKFYRIPKPLFYRRIHAKDSTTLFPNWRERMVWYDPGFKDGLVCPHWLQFFDYLNTIARAPLSFWERIQCFGTMWAWLFQDLHVRWMAKDLVVVTVKLMVRTLHWLGRYSIHRTHFGIR